MTGEMAGSYPIDSERPVSQSVITAVANAAGADETALPRLYDVVDPERLDDLYESADETLRVAFEYAGYEVLVNGGGRVVVAESAPDRAAPDIGSCARCGREFELDDDYRVATRREDGEVRFYGFCDDRCRAEWERSDGRSARRENAGDS